MECKFFSFYIIQLTYCMCTGAWPAVRGQDRWVWLWCHQKCTICDACGLCQTTRSSLTAVFAKFRLIHYAYELLRCLDVEIWRFSRWQWTKSITSPLALVHARGIIKESDDTAFLSEQLGHHFLGLGVSLNLAYLLKSGRNWSDLVYPPVGNVSQWVGCSKYSNCSSCFTLVCRKSCHKEIDHWPGESLNTNHKH